MLASLRLPVVMRRRAGAVAAVFAFLIAGTGYGEVVPPWEVPDEPWHAAYAEAIAGGRLPRADETYEAHQPPFYYTFVATGLRGLGRSDLPRSEHNLYFPFDASAYHHPPGEAAAGPVRLLRRYASLLAAITIVLTWSTAIAVGGSRLGPDPGLTAALAALVVALLPQHVFIANGLNNDTAAAMAGAAICYGAVRWVRGGPTAGRGFRIVALGLALGLLTKLNVLALIPAIVVASLVVARDPIRGLRTVARDLLVVAAPAFLIALALFFGAPELWRAIEGNALERALRPVSIEQDSSYLWDQLELTLESMVGRFGWLQIDLPESGYRLAAVMSAVAAVGLVALAWTGRRRSGRFRRRLGKGINTGSSALDDRPGIRHIDHCLMSLAVLGIGLMGLVAAVMRNLITDPQPQGRLLFPALGAAAVLFAFGWMAPTDFLRTRSGRSGLGKMFDALWSVTPILGLIALNAIALGRAIPAAYERSRIEPPAGQRIVRLLPEVRHLTARLERPGHRVVQTLSIATDRLARVSVPLENVEGRGILRMTLRHSASGASSSARHDLSRSVYERWAWIAVDAPPDLPASADAAIEVEIELEGKGVAVLWGSLDDFYDRGSLRGEPVADDTRRDLVLLFHYLE